jgi:gliding motility-associated-like protein
MKKEINNEPNWQELLREYQMPPSPAVWERIEAAQPTPLAVPKSGTRRMWWSAAAFVAVSLVAGYFVWFTPGDDAPETMEFFVPVSSDGSLNGTRNPEAVTPQRTSEPQMLTGHTEETMATNAPSVGSPAETGGSSAPTSVRPAVVSTTQAGTPGAPTEILPNIKPVTIPDPKQISLNDPPTASTRTDAGKPKVETSTQNTSEERLKVFIPNAFTPGSAGINNLFRPVIQNNEPVYEFKMQIFSRSGQLLYESVNIEEGWDGTFRGAPVEDRVCVYDISFRDQEGNPYRKWGTVVVIKQGM